jgi:Cytochrome P450
MVNSPPAEEPRSVLGRYPRRRPPGPRGLPLIGNVLALGNDPLGFFETTRRYGDLASLDLAGWQTLVVSDLPAVERILVEDHRSYVRWKS